MHASESFLKSILFTRMINIQYKFLIIIYIFHFAIYESYSKDISTPETIIGDFSKVWGFLKYYHPFIEQGKINWDSVYVEYLPEIMQKSKNQYNKILFKLLNDLGNVDTCYTCRPLYNFPNDCKRDLNLNWIWKDSLLSLVNKKRLWYIQENRYQGEGHYITYWWHETKTGPLKFINEIDYPDSILTYNRNYRLLALSRFWNAIEYFYPYKYLIPENWDSILLEYIPRLMVKTSLENYNLIMTRLIHEIKDTHTGNSFNRYLMTYKWNKMAPFDLLYVNGKTIVSSIRYPELNKVNDIRVGDIILKIDGQPIEQLRRELYPYFKASSESETQAGLNNDLFKGSSDTVTAEINRNGLIKSVNVTRYAFKSFWKYPFDSHPVMKIIKNIPVIDCASLQDNQVDSVMKIATAKKAIIFDMRINPSFNIGYVLPHLTTRLKPAYKDYYPSLDNVGIFLPGKVEAGKLDSGNIYNGRIIILVNEFTQSKGEWSSMILQSIPGAVTIGSQTAGADGNVSDILLPGNIVAVFSGVLIEYPDGGQCQQKGIKVDYVVNKNEDDIKNGTDTILNYAIKFINDEIIKNK